jgi:hypothetical protein
VRYVKVRLAVRAPVTEAAIALAVK